MLCEVLYSDPSGSTGVDLWYSPESLASGENIKQVTYDNSSHAGVYLSWDAARSTLLGKSAVVQREAFLQSDDSSVYAYQEEKLHITKIKFYE